MPAKKKLAPRRRKTADPIRNSFRMAAIDVGSNSLHMIVAQQDEDGSVTTLWRMKEMVGLGRMSFPSRRLSSTAMDAAIATLRRFQQAAQRRQCEKIVAVATSAVREAENGGDFLERIRRELGLNIRVVSAREEARLIYLGVRHEVDLRSSANFIVDIGGGSVEFIVADRHRAAMLESRKLGAARMTAKFVHSDPISKADLKTLKQQFEKELTPICETVQSLRPVRAIGTSGTLQSVAELCHHLNGGHDDRGRVIERATLSKLLSKLIDSTSKQRAAMPGLDDQRKDQIIAGVLLVHQLFDKLKLEKMEICGSALREGILLDYLARHVPELSIRRQVPDPRRRSVLDLARRCDWHETHSLQVAKLTLALFDQTRVLHKLGKPERELIEYGAMLHDIGWHISSKGHHKHSMYLVLHGNLKDFEGEEVKIIANISRYHRGTPPGEDHVDFVSLSDKAKKVVLVGAEFLRIADGLDRSHANVVESLRCTIKKQKMGIRLRTRSDAELEIWGARRKMDLFSEVFNRSAIFEEMR